MKRILCYGDSNTWGSLAHDGRLPEEKQWPFILGVLLGEDYRIIQEGLCGRFAGNVETGNRQYLNGKSAFEAIYRSATPVDILVLALGTNDLKTRYNRTSEQICQDILWYIAEAKRLDVTNEGSKVKVILVAPANFVSREDYFFADTNKWKALLELLKKQEITQVHLTDLEMTEDGVHYAESAHQRLADELSKKVKE